MNFNLIHYYYYYILTYQLPYYMKTQYTVVINDTKSHVFSAWSYQRRYNLAIRYTTNENIHLEITATQQW